MAKRKKVSETRARNAGPSDDGDHFGSFSFKKYKKEASGATNSKKAKADVGKRQALGPFPGHMRPLEEECRAARDGLALLHGEPEPTESKLSEKRTVLDSLVQTILSQNTTDTNSSRAFANLKSKFGSWEAVQTAPSKDIEAAIKLGGLAEIKTARIKDILNCLVDERGECSMEYLRELSDDEIKTDLTRFKGVGPKTVACVLMFCLDRFEFPVDTHVWRISKNLGWVPAKASREDTYEHLNTRIPDDIKFDLHVLLVEHGKRCARCAKNGKPRKEAHGPCPLVNLATTAGKGGRLSAEAAAEDADRAINIKEDPEALQLRPEDLKQEDGAGDSKVKDVTRKDVKVRREVPQKGKEEVEDAAVKVEIKQETM